MKIPTGLLIAGLAALALALSGCPSSGGDSANTATNTATKPAATKPAASQASGWTGDAIDFMYAGFDGSKGSASDFAGKPLVVNFWATW